jgi:hypothetical protein
MTFFKAFEHTSHTFFQISGVLANEFNIEKPVYYMTIPGQISGMNPYNKAASELYINKSIEFELKALSRLSVFAVFVFILQLVLF